MMQFVRDHLADPDLSAGRIAGPAPRLREAPLPSVGRAGISLGEWVREQRLEATKRDLADAGVTGTITAVHRWGFVDLTHFGRSFEAAYGLTPREWRAASRAGHGDAAAPATTRPLVSGQAGWLAREAEHRDSRLA